MDARVDEVEAAAVTQYLYSICGKARRLSGERDQNFCIETADRRYVLKLSNSAEDESITDLHTRALEHLANSQIPTPRLIKGVDGAVRYRHAMRSGTICEVRLFSYLEGRPLAEAPASDSLLDAIGSALGGLDEALCTFSHPADGHDLLWDLKRAERTFVYLSAIPDESGRDLARAGFELFSTLAVPRMPHLRTQLIHNDLNPHNVLVNEDAVQVSGILDLGDAVRSPLVNDVAVAAAYHVRPGEAPLSGVEALLRGYHRILPLWQEEIDLLHPLIVGRLAMTAAISAWRAQRYPSNAGYILRNAPAAFVGLKYLLEIPSERAARRLREAAGLPR
jgi:Ser/Thr protein kinase RdoA (MazF antagonist)